jgi:hypothetical protein
VRTFNRNMNFILAIMFTMLVACGQPVQEIEMSPTLPPETLTEISVRESYLTTIRTEYPVLSDVDDESLVGLAENTCGLLDTGATVYDVFDVANESGMPPEMSGYITGAAISAYCPEYLDQLE